MAEFHDEDHKLLDYCQADNRICSKPIYWNELYNFIPNKRRVEAWWEPGLPIILASIEIVCRKIGGCL